jgi:glycerol-3-phosphate acyltransferase PlsX
MPVTVAIDAMGGDFAPDEVVKGVAQVSLETDIQCTLVGDEQRIQEILGGTTRE